MQHDNQDRQAAEAEETLYLIDGYAALFRAFYAIRNPLYSSVTGEPTNAILVFAQMLLKLYGTFKPDYVVVAWDAPGKTFRDALFAEYDQYAQHGHDLIAPMERPRDEATPDQPKIDQPTPDLPALDAPPVVVPPPPVSFYKGTRRETPDSLHQQTPRILELLELFGIPVIGASGLEADDVIATLTNRALAHPAHPRLRVRIVTRDKDMEQLIGDRVTLFDIHTGAEMDEAALWSKRGVAPRQIADFLALTGDVVDNIPGVAGIGPKNAAKLLQQFGSLQEILNALEDASNGGAAGTRPVPTKTWESLERARRWLPLSRRLVTLEKEADIGFVLEQARARPFPAEGLAEFCDALGFVSLKARCAVQSAVQGGIAAQGKTPPISDESLPTTSVDSKTA